MSVNHFWYFTPQLSQLIPIYSPNVNVKVFIDPESANQIGSEANDGNITAFMVGKLLSCLKLTCR